MTKLVAFCLLQFPALLHAYDNGAPRSKLPPMGWSSWVALGEGWPGPNAKHPEFDFCDEGSVKASMDALIDLGLDKVGFGHFHLDDCWADKQRNASGFLQAERDHFPNGMKPIVDYAHSKGLTFGLYTCAGTHTCVGGRPGSKDHFEQDANVFAEWEVDVVKMDWCNTQGMEPAKTYAAFSKALNKTGRPIHFNMCEWGVDAPWEWGPSVAQSWRATGDHTGTWASTRSIIEQRVKVPAQQGGGPYAWNDMDMLETGNYKQAAHANGREGNMTETEYKTEFSMWAILASSMVVTTPILNCSTGTCLPSITPLQREILFNTEVIEINQQPTLAGRQVMQPGGGAQVFARNLWASPDIAVALYNPSDQAAEGSVEFKGLGLPAGSTASVRDLWAHKDLGKVKDRYPATGTVSIEPHATMVLRVAPTNRRRQAQRSESIVV